MVHRWVLSLAASPWGLAGLGGADHLDTGSGRAPGGLPFVLCVCACFAVAACTPVRAAIAAPLYPLVSLFLS